MMPDRMRVVAGWIFAILLSTLPAAADAPAFSWQHVPLYAHLGKTSGDLSKEEIRFLASHFSMVTIEKAQALNQRGSTEAGTKAAVAELKAANPRLKVFAYWNMFIDYDRMYASLRDPLPDRWFFGQAVTRNGGAHWRRYDPSNPEFRHWWIATAARLVAETGADGLFVDALPQIAAHPAEHARRLGANKATAMIAGAQQMLCGLQHALPKDASIIVNGLRSVPGGWSKGGAEFLGCVSGAMVEDLAYAQNATASQIAADIDIIRSAASSHKIVVVKGWPLIPIDQTQSMNTQQLEKASQRDLDFSLACFLIAAGDRTYFSYSWGFRAEDGWFRWYSQFGRELGAPLGAPRRHGWVFERAFAHASVWVDVNAKTARIEWR